MVGFRRVSDDPYEIVSELLPLDRVANFEQKIPLEWIKEDRTGLTEEFARYALPLIQGEPPVKKVNGLPKFAHLKMIKAEAEKFGLKNIQKAEIVNPKTFENKQQYAELMAQIRGSKGMTVEKALKQLDSPYYLGTLMIKAGHADGMVAGAICSTADTIRPALQYIKTAPGVSTVSGAFVVVVKDKNYGQDGVFLFADCAVNIAPNAEQLADIAIISAKTAKALAGIDPKVAMLSFSTKGSAQHEMVDKVTEATKIAQERAPELEIDGELQADAAMVQKVADLKAPGSKVAGNANVLVFPSLEAGNIGYKLVQRLAGADAVGPILQGMAAP